MWPHETSFGETAGPVGFRHEAIGPRPRFRPTITNVQVVDFDGDGGGDVLVCDAQKGAVFLYRRDEGADGGPWTETLLGEGLLAPAHATVVDLDKDGDADVVVSVMGNLYPDDDVIGKLVLLENRDGRFEPRTLLDDVRRVVDAQPADFDDDGDIDLAVAVFGYLRGQVLWLENRGELRFRDHELLSSPGTIHVPVADYDRDGDLDIAAVVSQEEEEVWGFENLGKGRFTPRRLWMTVNYDLGSAGLVKSDLDGDGDEDMLLPVGDNLEDAHSIAQPYHGCFWFENQGEWKFAPRRIATFPGTYAAATGDLDADGDQDVVLCSMVNDWEDPTAASLTWLENDGHEKFTQHKIASRPIMLVTVACGDLNRDKRIDVVAGGLHMYPPFERLGRVSAWVNEAQSSAAKAPESAATAGNKLSTDASPEHSSRAEIVGGVPAPSLRWLDRLTAEDLQQAHDALATRVAMNAATSGDWRSLGEAYYAYGLFGEATECFAAAAKLEPEAFQPAYLWGVGMARMGKLESAIEQLEATAKLANARQAPWAWTEIGRCWLKLEKPKEAEAAFVKAGEYPLALLLLAKLRIRDGRPQEAVEQLNSLTRMQPNATEVLLLKARAAESMGNAPLATQMRDRAEYNSQRLVADPIALMVDEAQSKYGARRLVEESQQLISEKKWEEAHRLLTQVVEATPSIDATVMLAGVDLEMGSPDESIAILTKLIGDRGMLPVAMLLLGDAYAKAGKEDDAVAYWEATARARRGASLEKRLADHYAKAGDATAEKRHRALALVAAGVGALRAGAPGRAKPILEEAVKLDATLADAWFYLGECRRFTGDLAGARDAYANAVEHAPEHGRAVKSLEEIER